MSNWRSMKVKGSAIEPGHILQHVDGIHYVVDSVTPSKEVPGQVLVRSGEVRLTIPADENCTVHLDS